MFQQLLLAQTHRSGIWTRESTTLCWTGTLLSETATECRIREEAVKGVAVFLELNLCPRHRLAVGGLHSKYSNISSFSFWLKNAHNLFIQSLWSGLKECIGKLRFLAKHLISFCFHRETNGMVGMPGAVSPQTDIALEEKTSCSYSVWYTPLESLHVFLH